MRDLELERRFPQPRFMPKPRRCPCCGALPPNRWLSLFEVRPGLVERVETCSSHYCRSRAAEFTPTAIAESHAFVETLLKHAQEVL